MSVSKSLINTKNLKRLKNSLPKNGMQEIADKIGVSVATVSRAFSGENKSRINQVVEIALTIIERQKSIAENLNKRIDSI